MLVVNCGITWKRDGIAMAFVVIVERSSPGAKERMEAVVMVEHGRAYWTDAAGKHPYSAISADDDGLRSLAESAAQGNRRGIYIENQGELVEALRLVAGRAIYAHA